ncbi:MAG TPA: glycosyltransferase family 2 protein [Opitutaceae bacterium]|jgi:GT2 family glycosyltransferase|nr:glycosyltransferase family 2 protein [Opitutaceae bacterium]
MTRNSEDASPHLPDNPPPNPDPADGRIRAPDSVPLEQPAFPSIEIIGDELCRLNVVDSPIGLQLEPIQGNPKRRDYLSKASFRVTVGNRTVCHLTVGRNLAPLWERTQSFASACPEITCRPLFFHRSGEWDYLGIEFFDGRNLDSLAVEGQLTPAEALKHGGAVLAALERTFQPSNVEAAAQEIDALFAQVCALPIFAEFDRNFLQQVVFPFVRAGALAGPGRTRWTNGDLIPRNVLADKQGKVRLVDYEFAVRTHFFAEDAWRWRTFSALPPEVRELPGLGDGVMPEPWIEAFFLLRHLILAHDINGAQKAAVDLQPALDRLVGLAVDGHAAFHASLFLQRLASVSRLKELGRAVTGDALSELTRLRDLLYQREEKIRAMQESFSWQSTAPLRALRRTLLDRYSPPLPPPPDPARLPKVNFPYSLRDFEDDTTHFYFGIDHPRTWARLVGQVEARGWCFAVDQTPLNAVRARVGDRIFPGVYGQPRPDIAARHAQFSRAEHCGFKIELTLEPNDNLVVIEAGDEQGNWRRILTRSLGKCASYENYDLWVRVHDTLTPEAAARIQGDLQRLKRRPLISVLMPVYNTPEKWLMRAIGSVRSQIYEQWELCIADDASTEPHIRPLLEKAAAEDSRIKVFFRETNGHISAASNSALALARGDFVALLDHDDELRPHALACMAFELDRFPNADLIYSDEDKINEDGFRYGPYFKPDWNPDLFLAQNFICHLSAYRLALVREIGGFRVGYEGSQDWDLAMRVIERIRPSQIRHIPQVLYHWRAIQGSTAIHVSEKNYSVTAAGKVVADHFERVGIKATVSPTKGHYWRVHYPLPNPAPSVTLIIPTRNRVKLLRPCVGSILKKTTYPDYKILVVDNNSDEPETLAYLDELRQHPRCRVLTFPGPFNYSSINNFAVHQANSPLIGLLNNDLEVINGDWLDEMASQALRPEIGCVGAKLYYPDGRIQHAGLILGIGGMAGHAWHGFPRDTHGQGYRALLQQTLSAVTAACLVIRRETYLKVGGLDEENFKVALNDVDFCLKVRAAGFRNLFTPFAELYHHESASRGYEDTEEKRQRFSSEVERLQRKWGEALFNDPAYNPNLTLDRVDFSLANPPRVPAFGQ